MKKFSSTSPKNFGNSDEGGENFNDLDDSNKNTTTIIASKSGEEIAIDNESIITDDTKNSYEEKAFLDHHDVELSISPKSSSIQTATIGGYALTILGTQMLNHIFNSYYVETFLFIHNLPYNYFYIGQFLFAIFNAVNDPLFGYISDELINDKKKRYSRQRLMLFGAPFLVISFLLPWIQIRGLFEGDQRTGLGDFIAFVQFICALFFWDTSFTWLVLNHCALLPELTESDKEKGKISTAVSTCSVLGSLFLLPTFILFERPSQDQGNSKYTGNLNYFRIYCTCLAVLSFCIIYFGNYLINRGRAQSLTNTPVVASEVSDEEVPEAPETRFTFRHLLYIIKNYLLDFFSIFKQLISLKNFDLFVAVNFLNIFSVALFDSFKVRYIRNYVQPWMEDNFSLFTSGNMASIYLTVTTFTSESCAVLNSYLSIRFPAYSLLRNTFILRCVISIICLIAVAITVQERIIGSALPVLFLFCNMIILGSVGRLLEIALSNVVDEDYVVFKRKEKNSGNTFGINALLTKPAYSLAPSVAALFVNQDKVESGASTLFYLFVVGNLVCAALQLVFWKFYSLKGQQQTTNNANSRESSAAENCH